MKFDHMSKFGARRLKRAYGAVFEETGKKQAQKAVETGPVKMV
jgi:hypothetical protein